MHRIGSGGSSQQLSLNNDLAHLNLNLKYDLVIKNIVPVVSKRPGFFSLGWTVSKQAKIKAMRMQRQINEKFKNRDAAKEEENSGKEDDEAEDYNAMGNYQDSEGNSSGGEAEGMNDDEARALYANVQLPDDDASRKDTKSRRSRSSYAKSVASSSKKSMASSKKSSISSSSNARSRSETGSQVSRASSGKRVQIMDASQKGGKRTWGSKGGGVKDIMEHVYVLDKFIEETRTKMADK